jgi:hypothetical protein
VIRGERGRQEEDAESVKRNRTGKEIRLRLRLRLRIKTEDKNKRKKNGKVSKMLTVSI